MNAKVIRSGMPTPLEAIEVFMDKNGLSKADMVQFLGSPSKVSEVLNGKRSLSKTMICKLVEGLGIPAEILLEVQPPQKGSYLLHEMEKIRAGYERLQEIEKRMRGVKEGISRE